MKKTFFSPIQLLAGLLLTAAASSSCNKLINIPPNPPSQITQAQQFADSATTMTAVAAVYTYYNSGSGFTYNDALIPSLTGLSSDELSTTETDVDHQEYYNYSLTSLNQYMPQLWGDPYTGLYPVNAILAGIQNNNALSVSLRTQLTGEMEVVRSLYYFYLTNLFGAVPLVTSIDYKVTSAIGRTPIDSVYAQIISDLTDAQQKLTAAYPSQGRVRPNLYTASALLAKVYLYQQKWQDAYDAADTVISSGLYTLEPNLNNVFLDGSQEAIWQIPANSGYNLVEDAVIFVPSASGTAPNYPISSFLLNAFETGDQRQQNWMGQTSVSGQTVYYPFKYKNRNAFPTTTEDYMVFRLGELLLIRAEAAAQLGNTTAALADLNQVRARAGLSNSTASSQTDILTAIMHERQVELFTEWGNRWFDLKRTGTADAILGTEKTGWQPNAALYPLPQTQLQFNSLLRQNPGY
jgi:hypothetical protein